MNNLVLTDRHTIDVVNNKFSLNNSTIDVSDVAYVRYRFEDFSLPDTLDYIGNSIKKFYLSSHLIEVNLSEHSGDDINNICDTFENVIAFLYIDVDDIDVDRGCLSEQKILLLKHFKECDAFVERVMLKDKSSSLYTISGNRIRESVANLLGISTSDIGFCQSPLSLCDGNCCLTAERARKLSAEYNEFDSASLPSSNHEFKNGNNCGCIKYHVVTNPLTFNEKLKDLSAKKDGTGSTRVSKPKGIAVLKSW